MPAFVVGTTQLVAVCLRHALGVSGPRVSASDVQAELLSTYAVDLMPLERVSGPLKARRANGGANPQEILVTLLGLVFQAIGYAISAVMTLLFLAWALAIVVGVVAWMRAPALSSRCAQPWRDRPMLRSWNVRPRLGGATSTEATERIESSYLQRVRASSCDPSLRASEKPAVSLGQTTPRPRSLRAAGPATRLSNRVRQARDPTAARGCIRSYNPIATRAEG